MTSIDGTTAVDAAPTEAVVPVPRPAPRQEERPRRRHDGYYWDVVMAAWRPCSGG